MMHHEFEQIAGYEVSYEDYANIIEPMYTATNLSKQEFVKVIDKKRFALPTKAEMKKQMRKIAWKIFQECGLRDHIDEEKALYELAEKYAERFYHGECIITRDYAYCGTLQSRGCTFPEEVVIFWKDTDVERIALVG